KGERVREGRVVVSYKVSPDKTLLTIEDDGIGAEEMRGTGGSGIGGALMAAFARQVHGQLEESVSPAGGRLVRIRMPRIDGKTGTALNQLDQPANTAEGLKTS